MFVVQIQVQKVGEKMDNFLSNYQYNVNNYDIRYENYQGRKHIVVPVVMMVEGVHNGSGGPVYHSINELGRYPESWNGRPVTIHHPAQNGAPVSAASPTVLESQSVGILFNTHVDGTKLKSEAWIDVDKIATVSPSAYQYILQKRPLEVSIGTFTDEEHTEGDWNGEHYIAVAHNHRPDHLALLPGGRGACSWADGAGVRANSEHEGGEKKMDKSLVVFVDRYAEAFRDVVNSVQRQLDAMDTENVMHFLEEVYSDNTFIYNKREPSGQSFYKASWVKDGNGVVSIDTSNQSPVVRKVEYVTAVSNNNVKGVDENMDKKKLIDELITLGAYEESSRAELETVPEKFLEGYKATFEENKRRCKEEKDPVTTATLDVNSVREAVQGMFQTPEQFIALMPKDMQDQMNSGLRLHNEQKQNLVNKIAEHTKAFTTDELNAKTMDELQKIVSLIPDPVDYSLQGVPSVRVNRSTSAQETPLLPYDIISETKKD